MATKTQFDQNGHTSEAELAGLRGGLTKEDKRTSYPTRSLNFLHRLERSRLDTSCQLKPIQLRIIVVGAGLGGLAAAIALARNGHEVTVLEAAPELGEVGAGIQIPPNSSRLLLDWGLEPYLRAHVVEPECIQLRRWKDSNVIGLTKLKPDFRIKYQAPYYLVHRAHFHSALYKLALHYGVKIKVNSKVTDYFEQVPSVTVQSGESFTADLVVAADGLKSIARRIVNGKEVAPQTSGFAAFRATVPAAKLREDPELAWLLDTPGQHMWIGHERHIMSYCISSGESFNMVLNYIDHSDPSTWKAGKEVEEMRAVYEGWDPRITKILKMIDHTLKWPPDCMVPALPVMTSKTLDKWVSKSGKLVILGDAAHVMVPYMSQGAAIAVEDGAALAEALRHAYSADDIIPALKVYQDVRIKRSSQMQQASLVNGVVFHFPDGPEQRARDAAMRAEVEGRVFTESPNQWSDPTTQAWAYGYDAVGAVADAFQELITTQKSPADLGKLRLE